MSGIIVGAPTSIGATVTFPRGNTANIIATGTSDGSDNAYVGICGGGAYSTSRGAILTMYGNESVGAGLIQLRGGEASGGGSVRISSGSDAAAQVRLEVADLRCFYLDNNGDFQQDSTYGRQIVFTRNNYGIRYRTEPTLTAAGTDLAGADQIAATINRYTTVASGAGAKLSDVTGIGSEVRVINSGANALLVYPPNVSSTINGGGGGGSVSIATGACGIFIKVAASTWVAHGFAAA